MVFTVCQIASAQTPSEWNDINNQAWDYFESKNLDSALVYLERGIEISKQIHNKEDQEQILNYFNAGVISYQIGEYVRALKHLNQAIEGMQFASPMDKKELYKIYEYKVACLDKEAMYKKLAEAYIEQSNYTNDLKKKADIHNSAGSSYMQLLDYNNAANQYKTALKELSTYDADDIQASVYAGNAGYAYSKLKEKDSSIHYFWEGAKLHERLNKKDTVQYGNLVMHMGDQLFINGEYDAAVLNYKVAWRAYSKDEVKNSQLVLLSLDRIILTYDKLKEGRVSFSYAMTKLDHLKLVKGSESSAYTEYLESIVTTAADNWFCKNANDYLDELKNIHTKRNKVESKAHFLWLVKYSEWNQKCHKRKALRTLKKANKWLSKYADLVDASSLAKGYFQMAEVYDYLDKEKEYLATILAGSEITQDAGLQNKHSLYFYQELGDYYYNIDSTKLALNYYISAERSYRTIYPKLGYDYLKLADRLSLCYAKLKYSNEAKNYAQLEKTLAKELMGENSYEYFKSYYTLVRVYYDIEEFDSSRYYLNKAKNVDYKGSDALTYQLDLLFLDTYKVLLNVTIGKETISYNQDLEDGKISKVLRQLLRERLNSDSISSQKLSAAFKEIDDANFLYETGSLLEAKSAYEKILIASEALCGPASLETALLNKQLGNLSIRLHQFKEANQYIQKSLELTEQVLHKKHTLYIDALLDKARLLIETGRYDQAFYSILELTEVTEEKFGAENYYSLKAWLLWAMLNSEVENYQRGLDAIFYIKEVAKDSLPLQKIYAETEIEFLNIRRKMGLIGIGFPSPYNTSMMGSEYYQNINTESIQSIDEAIAIVTQFEGKSSPVIASLLCDKAYLLGLNGEEVRAKSLFDKYVPEVAKRYGKLHPEYRRHLQNLGYLYQIYSNWEVAVNYYLEANDILIHEVSDVFSFSGELHRKSFLDKIEYQFDKLQQFDFQSNNASSKISAQSLNNHLTLKGLLLNNQKTILSNLMILGNPKISAQVERYKKLKIELNEQLFLPAHLRNKAVYELIAERDSIEAILIKKHSEAFPDYAIESGDWKKIQTQLKQGEIAIEFSQFHYDDAEHFPNRVKYVAYIIEPKAEYPRVVYLGKQKEIKSLLDFGNPNGLYASRGVQVESTLPPSFDNSIYNLVWEPLEQHLSAAKTIHFSASGVLNKIPYAALEDSTGIALCDKYNLRQYHVFSGQSSKRSKIDEVLLVGGLKYQDHTVSKSQKKLRKSIWTYLPGTAKEVSAIKDMLGSKYMVSLVNDTLGTEEYIKSISQNSPKVMHIATHGFYTPDTTGELSEALRYFISLKTNPMMRSGLLLSYAHKAWTFGNNEERVEDGILNSAEIANLDFSNTELVVLSACETGLGDIEGNEGVMGLQRGFRMAGVNNLVVSLWPVLDEETAEFMTLFYKNLMNSSDMRSAFNATQKAMHEKYGDEPYKWAGFVLIE